MIFLRDRCVAMAAGLTLAACGSAGPGGQGGSGGAAPTCDAGSPGKGPIAHVVVIIQENHTFDAYFGRYCTAAPGSSPTCNAGPGCCEAAPTKEPSGRSPVVLDDAQNGSYDPDHHQACELGEMDQGKMDRYTSGTACSDPQNFAIASDAVVAPYHALASQYALADRYFQPIAGQSSSNDMYFAVAKEVFIDNAAKPDTAGQACDLDTKTARYEHQTTVADLLRAAGKSVAFYAEGWDQAKAAGSTSCPVAPACPLGLPVYPCGFDPGDVPFLYYAQFADDPTFMRDYAELAGDLGAGTLPDVAFVKGYGFHSEHPGYSTTISAGAAFVDATVQQILGSCQGTDTLVLVTWDEGGGFFDHVRPPPESAVDHQPYGTRVPLLALGPFARKGFVSHVELEHSSIVRFLEQNFLGKTGQLGARDAVVADLASLLEP